MRSAHGCNFRGQRTVVMTPLMMSHVPALFYEPVLPRRVFLCGALETSDVIFDKAVCSIIALFIVCDIQLSSL